MQHHVDISSHLEQCRELLQIHCAAAVCIKCGEQFRCNGLAICHRPSQQVDLKRSDSVAPSASCAGTSCCIPPLNSSALRSLNVSTNHLARPTTSISPSLAPISSKVFAMSASCTSGFARRSTAVNSFTSSDPPLSYTYAAHSDCISVHHLYM